jgi:hypothetical protein
MCSTRPQRLHVRDDTGQTGALGDRDHFVDRRDHADAVVGLVTDVTGVTAAALGRGLGHLDDLGGGGVAAGRVIQAARQAERAGTHPVADEADHPRQLRRRGIAVGHAENLAPHRAVRDHQADVQADAVALVAGALGGEVDRTAAVRIDEHGGDALGQHWLAMLQVRGRQARAGVGMDVDEARRHEPARDVEHRRRRRRAEIADRGDAVGGDADVGAPRRGTAAIEHLAAAEQDVEALLRVGAGRPQHDDDGGGGGQCGAAPPETHVARNPCHWCQTSQRHRL